jgi:hypothetical protein
VSFRKPCIDCGELSRSTRCDTCAGVRNQAIQAKRDADPNYKAKKARLYNSQYRRQAQAVKAGATHCALCHQPFQLGDRIEADHINPGDPTSPLQPAHRLCNQRKGGKG